MRIGKVVWTVLLLLLLVFPAAAEESDNLLVNGGFESLNGQGLPAGWYTDAYVHQEGYTLWGVSDDARGGEHSALISNFGANDARFAQRVEVEPNSIYCFSGYVKVIDMSETGRGANLSIEGLYVFSESLRDATDNWVKLELYGRTGPDQREVTLFARVGGYSGESIGTAQFDDLSLRKVPGVPGHATETMWYYEQQAPQTASVDEEEEASPFWPWLLLISACYLLLGVWMIANCLQRKPRELTKRQGAPVLLIVGLAVAVAARIATALMVEGYPTDVGCFVSWGHTMATKGPMNFYQTTSFCDYTPGYLYVLGFSHAVLKPVCGWIAGLFGASVSGIFPFKLVPIACDIAMAYLLYRMARKHLDRRQSEVLGVLFALNPAMALNSAGWSQIDSALCLCLMLVAWLAVERKWAAVLPVYVFSALVKPQALMLGPLGLIAIIMVLVQDARDEERFQKTGRQMLIGLGLSAAVAAVVIVPYSLRQKSWTWLFDLYGKTLSSYPYATVNTANLYYFFGANWVGISVNCPWWAALFFAALSASWGGWLAYRQRKLRLGWLEPAAIFLFSTAYLAMMMVQLIGLHMDASATLITWGALGTTSMVMSFVIVLGSYIRSGKLENLPLCGAVLFILLYMLGIKMHERYLFPALILLAMAYAIRRDIRVIGLLLVTSCTLLINEGIILDNALRLGATQGHLNNDTRLLNDLVSLVNVACALLAMWTCRSICLDDKELTWKRPTEPKPARKMTGWHPDAGLHWKRLDWVLMLSVTAVYAIVTLTTLGSTKAPENPWKSTAYDEAVIIDLGQHYDDVSMLYFCRVSYNDFSVAVSEDGETWSHEYWAEMKQGLCYRWKYLESCYDSDGERNYRSASTVDDVQKLSGRYVRVTAQQIGLILNEVIFRDASGQTIPATVLRAEHVNEASPNLSDPAALLDEQDSLEGEPGWWNGTYFDEIYHARTAFEHLHGLSTYETSHPPLGKVIMSWGVAIFGMTPFGWRFAGAFAGVLMLPAMYVLGKQISKRTSIGFAAMTMMALDCMHFTQTRIATIDSFPVLFIILSWLFMLRFMQRDIAMEPIKRVLPDLALSGFFMGCGIASKWIGIYSGAGLAVMYFWTCARHLRLRGKVVLKRLFHLCLWCLLFFVTVPLVIYLLSYIPYFAHAYKEDVFHYLRMVYDAQLGMFNYHSTPGLGMDHPFYTPWYEWPLIKRPMYYASPRFTPEGWSYAIWCFGNPMVWLAGLGCIIWVAAVWAKRHVYRLEGSELGLHLTSWSWSVEPAFILVGFLAQFLPWVLVPRGTYIYHYFASIPFLILSVAMVFHWVQERYPMTGRILLIAYLAVCLGFFVAYFPYASGVLTPTSWLDYMKKFLRIYY